MSEKKTIIRWAGFSEGKIDTTNERETNEKILAIYPNKEIAKRNYQDYRKIVIKEFKPKRKLLICPDCGKQYYNPVRADNHARIFKHWGQS